MNVVLYMMFKYSLGLRTAMARSKAALVFCGPGDGAGRALGEAEPWRLNGSPRKETLRW